MADEAETGVRANVMAAAWAAAEVRYRGERNTEGGREERERGSEGKGGERKKGGER